MVEKIEQIIWPTPEQMYSNMASWFKLIQVFLDGNHYYRFGELQKDVVPHPKTSEFAKMRGFQYSDWTSLKGHQVVLDQFVRELIEKGYDPLSIEDAHGCDAKYDWSESRKFLKLDKDESQIVDLVFSGASGYLGKPNWDLMMNDLRVSKPAYLELQFVKW